MHYARRRPTLRSVDRATANVRPEPQKQRIVKGSLQGKENTHIQISEVNQW